MRVFFDTNVLVSAFAARGLCADLFRMVLAEHELLVGEVVLTELRRVLRDRIRVAVPTVQAIDVLLREHPVTPRPRAHLSLGLVDADDEWIVASAVAAQAELLVSGDRALLATRKPPVPIVSPRTCWDTLRRVGGD